LNPVRIDFDNLTEVYDSYIEEYGIVDQIRKTAIMVSMVLCCNEKRLWVDDSLEDSSLSSSSPPFFGVDSSIQIQFSDVVSDKVESWRRRVERRRIHMLSFRKHFCRLRRKMVRNTLNNVVLCSLCRFYLDRGVVWCKRK